jgi:hypothetical protein
MTATAAVMGPAHERWREFADRLGGPEGCNFRPKPGDPEATVWECGPNHTHDHTTTRALLADMGFTTEQTEASIDFFFSRCGKCACLTVMNVDDAYDHYEAPDGQGGLGADPDPRGKGTVGGLRVRKIPSGVRRRGR